jgi:outer membrane protein
MNHKLQVITVAAVAAFTTGAAMAQSTTSSDWMSVFSQPIEKPNIVKGGGIFYQTHSSTTGITGIGIPPGADAETGDAWTVLVTYERLVTPNFGVELVLGWPPTITAKATGSVSFLGDNVLEAKNVAPTLLFNYHFGKEGDVFRPYLGAGINYTHFTDIKTTLPVQSVDMSDSWGWAVQAGFDYRLTPQWGLFASIAAIDVKSDLVAVGSTVLKTTIDFKPVTYAFGVSYRF